MADKSPWDLAIVLLQLRKEERAEPARSGHGLHGLIISLLSVKECLKDTIQNAPNAFFICK